MNKMKIVQINVFGKLMSTGRTTWEMHQYFLENGLDSYLVTAQNNEDIDNYTISNKIGIKLDVMLTLLSGLEGYHSTFQTKKLLKYLDKVKPDIIHLRNLHQNYININLLLRYLSKKNIPTVVTMHDFYFITGKCFYFNLYNCEKWRTGCFKCPAMKFDTRKRLFDRTKKMWRDKKKYFEKIPRLAVVGNSKYTTEITRQSMLKSANIVDCIYNWIDFSIFHPKNTNDLRTQMNLENKKIILAVSTLWQKGDRKGFDKYLELSEQMPNDYHLILVGKTFDNFSSNEKITFIPQTKDTNKLSYIYSLADVYLNLSKGETFGKSAAEAVCCGTPIIAINSTANPEIVPNGAGEVLETDNIENILVALNNLLSKPKTYYLSKCLDHAHNNFDKEKNIKKYIEIYNGLVDWKKK